MSLTFWVKYLVRVVVRVMSEGLTGDGPLPSSLVWSSAIFSSSRIVGLRYSYLLAVAWRPPLVNFLLCEPVHWVLTTWQSTSFRMMDGVRGRAQHGNHHLFETQSQKWHPITFAIFCSLEVSHRVQPTRKGIVEYREEGIIGELF